MKYNIENNIDFYSQLYISLDDSKNNDDDGFGDNDCCLISNLPLINNFVKLKCGHKFNYAPLYKDIFNHKKKFNNMEQIQTKLKQNQIRCPYCRNVQDELLPYYENFGYPKEHGINFYDVNKANNDNYNTGYVTANHQCQYQIINLDASGNSHTHQCNHFGHVHSMLKNKYNNENKYCYTHKLAVVKQIKETIKQDNMNKKLEEKNKKLEEKNKKLEEKNKKIEEKNKLKMELLQKKLEVNINSTNCNQFCKAILKSGKNKGTQCFANTYKDCLCKRHYVLGYKDYANNTIIEENIVIEKDIKI
jgi:hypothetical protein